MFSRVTRATKSPEAVSGKPQLTLAKWIVFTEAALRCFARPLMLAGLFLALAWMGAFAALFPWAHLVALTLFVILFFDALGRAQHIWKYPSSSLAKRRVEEASGLTHRPLDVPDDYPVTADAEAQSLWQAHVLHAREQVKDLRWPRWTMNIAAHDPYRLRYALLALLIVGVMSGWGTLGGRLIAAINPALGKLPMSTATLDAWITPPDYAHASPIMIATPGGARYQNDVIEVPEGSMLYAHLAEKDGDVPVLEANGQKIDFVAEDEKDFGATQVLQNGDRISIHRGWMTLASWRIRVVRDTAPTIAFTEPPSATERRDLRIAYDAKDDFGINTVSLRVTPRETIFGISNDPVDIPLASADDKHLKRVAFKDLTSEPRAGTLVDLQLVATDANGHKGVSEKVAVTLPERIFFQPIARALIEERKKLLSNIFDGQARNEAANLMAGLAHQPASFNNDPVVLMALRAGAVRLVLEQDRDATLSVKDILWQTAMRIEDGSMGMAERNLKQVQQDLADALDRNADEKEIQALMDRLHQALASYLAELSARIAQHPPEANDLRQVLGQRMNALTPADLERMIDTMKGLSASGSRDEAREELSRLQQILENVQQRPTVMSTEQKQALATIKALRALAHDQQQLLDATFQKAQNGDTADGTLAASQKALLLRLHGLMGVATNDELAHGADAMRRAEQSLHQSAGKAVPSQTEALKALQQAEEALTDNLRQSLFALPSAGSGSASSDPFGRGGDKNGSARDNGKVRVPDQFETRHVRDILNEIQRRAGDLNRPKSERDYIERLLQNF